MAGRQRGDERVDYLRRLVLSRCSELTADEIAEAFTDDEIGATYADAAEPDQAAILTEIADAVTGAIEALETRLDELERALPWRVH